MIAFLASGDARFVTGVCVAVDGGMSLGLVRVDARRARRASSRTGRRSGGRSGRARGRSRREATADRVERAVADGRDDEARALVRQLPVEAEEIHELYTAWSRADGRAARRRRARSGAARGGLAGLDRGVRRVGAGRAARAAARRLAAAHDRHLQEVADLVDRVVEAWGEERLGELWADLQADGTDVLPRDVRPRPAVAGVGRAADPGRDRGHARPPRRPGAARRGDGDGARRPRRADVRHLRLGRADPGRRRATACVEGTHDFAWSTPGVCRYCVHCCVLQQLTPIDDFGYPARVIDPPTRPGEPCTWTVYRDPSLVPAEAYERVGRTKPDG